jgi:3-hydroxybutyryl-CoA dehydratase
LVNLKAGFEVSFTKKITKKDINLFSDVSGDRNPLHFDKSYASKTIFKEPIAHGLLGAGLISAALGNELAPESVVVYLNQNLKFISPVKSGDTLTAKCKVISYDPIKSHCTLDTCVLNQKGQQVIIGEARVLITSFETNLEK